jgi:hypothetical protein
VRILGVIAPGGVEDMFDEQAAYLAQLQGPPDPERLNAILAPTAARPARRSTYAPQLK